MRKLSLLSAVLLLGMLFTQVSYANGAYKYTSAPHLPIQFAQNATDAIYVPVNVQVADVRVAIHAKTIMYHSLRITLTSPYGVQVVLKEETPGVLYGSLGSSRSMLLFQDDGNPWGDVPNDVPVQPDEKMVKLNGTASMGWWQLQIIDDRSGLPPQNGFLEKWVLMFNRQIIEPVQPINPPVNIVFPGGASLFGQINGSSASQVDPMRAQIPNEDNGQVLCNTPGNDPNVLLGLNGDAFPVTISGHPGALIGQDANGYPAGRFRVTLTVETNYRPGSNFLDGFTEDIAMYFGKVDDNLYSPPIPAPPVSGDPQFMAKMPAGWPTGAGPTGSLLGGSSGIWGGVRLAACLSPVPFVDVGGYTNVTFDDFAIESITNAPQDASGGYYGTYKPEQPLGSLNGLPLDGLYYVTVYDTYGDQQGSFPNDFGHIRVTYLQVEYIAGGGEIADPTLHQGVAGPLMGVPIPGTFTGASLGYLSDVVGTIPPYSMHAKDQDPILTIWATQKVYPKDAVGTERIQAVNSSNYAPPSGTHYHGPYAYPGSLDADRTKAGVLVNADVLVIPEGDYNLRLNLMQARYDDDLGDNEYESAKLNVNESKLGYFGHQITQYSDFVDPQHSSIVASGLIGEGQGMSQSFTLFKFPTTKVTAVDFRFDEGTVITPQTNVQATIWACNNGYTGAPSTVVGRSPQITLNEYIKGNWRSFPIYEVDANGDPDLSAGSVDLAPGTYVFEIANVSTSGDQYMVYPYTYKMMPALHERNNQYIFGDLFGPIGPFATLGTRMGYFNTDVSSAPDQSFGATLWQNMANHALPMCVNLTSLNDFSVNYVRFSSQTSPTEAIAVGQPVTPSVNCSSLSPQGGLTKDFNIYLAIYDAGNTLLYSDMVNIANAPYFGIQPYQTLGINMTSWTPTSGGLYTVKAYFTRNPDDQNELNDYIEYQLFVAATPIIALGNNADQNQINDIRDELSASGLTAEIVSVNDLAATSENTVYFVGDMDDAARTQLEAAIANGSDIAFVYDKRDIGSTIGKFDRLYNVQRMGSVDYSQVTVGMVNAANGPSESELAVAIDAPTFRTKEDLLSYLQTADLTPKAIEPAEMKDNVAAFRNVLPPAIGSDYGDIRVVSHQSGNLGVLYTFPTDRKSIAQEPVTPVAFNLEQNYPNPFNPSTVISYTLPEASQVTLRVTDLLGREVATLVNSSQDAGVYNISWKGQDQNGNDVASGSYFYRLEASPANGGPAFISLKKMMLSK